MNDTIIIALPTWFYWLLVAWLFIDAIRTTLNLFNQYLQYRLGKNF